MPIDKAVADCILFRYRHDHQYRLHFDWCPCCGHEDDMRNLRAFGGAIRVFGHVPPAKFDDTHAYRMRCRRCGGRWLTVYDDTRLVGFRNLSPR